MPNPMPTLFILLNKLHIMQENASVSLDVPLPEKRVFRYQAMQDVLQQLITDPFDEFTQQELAMSIV